MALLRRQGEEILDFGVRNGDLIEVVEHRDELVAERIGMGHGSSLDF
jgi:hypothetical protein